MKIQRITEFAMFTRLGRVLKTRDILEGVKIMKIAKGDSPVSRFITEGVKEGLVITQNGYGKKFLLSDIKLQKYGGSGVKMMKISLKSGVITTVIPVKNKYVNILTVKGLKIKIPVNSIPVSGLLTQGIQIIKVEKGDRVCQMK